MPSKRLVRHGARGSQQVHMNRVRFDPYRYKLDDQKLPPGVVEVMTSLCCRRCCDILQWKVDYGKYIPLERHRRCNCCHEGTVALAFHHICQKCALETARCAKCQKPPLLRSVAKDTEKTDDMNGKDESEDGDEDLSGESPDSGARKDGVSSKYAFVEQEDSDEEFWPLRGLDIRQLKRRKAELSKQEERDRIGRLRERERRAALRRALRGSEHEEEYSDSDMEI